MKFSVSNKYIFKLHFINTIIVQAVFIFLFALIDSLTTTRGGFLISFLASIANLDSLFAFIALVSTIITLMKMKHTAEDVAFISIGKSPSDMFKIFTISSIVIYFILILVLHPIAFEILKQKDRVYFGKNCTFDSTGKLYEEGVISINSTKYTMCDGIFVLSELDLQKNLNDNSPLSVKIYQKKTKKDVSIFHNMSNNVIDNIVIQTKTAEELARIRRIDQYKADLKMGQISIYHIIYLALRDHTGIIGKGEILDVILYKGRNTMLVVLFVNFCYFAMISNRRSREIGKIVVKTIVFAMIYYIFSYIMCEKLVYADALLIKFLGFFLIHILVYFILRHIQYQAFLSFSDFLRDLKKNFKIS